MEIKYIDPLGNETKEPTIDFLKKVLMENYSIWESGSGDSALEGFEESLIFFKVKEGVFIMCLSEYLSPLIKSNLFHESLIHYVGGEPMSIPKAFICEISQAINIFDYFIKNKGKLNSQYQWVDFSDYI